MTGECLFVCEHQDCAGTPLARGNARQHVEAGHCVRTIVAPSGGERR